MLSRLLVVAVLISFHALEATTQESSVQSALTDTTSLAFLPHHVGDLWHYWHSGAGHITTVLTRDSVSPSGSHFLFYNNNAQPTYAIDTACQIFDYPVFTSNGPRYKLDADSGTVWRTGGLWAWCAKVDSAFVFGRPSVVKIFRYSPGYPDSAHAHQFLEECYLASGFGLIYWEGEPGYIEQLWGCVIGGDTLGTITSIERVPKETPPSFSLQQNYPNPFNPVTTIGYSLPKHSHVSLTVFTALGQAVATLVDGEVEAGYHETKFDGSALPSGVYFYRIRGGDYMQTKMFLLLR